MQMKNRLLEISKDQKINELKIGFKTMLGQVSHAVLAVFKFITNIDSKFFSSFRIAVERF
jgi:hypothetical protein